MQVGEFLLQPLMTGADEIHEFLVATGLDLRNIRTLRLHPLIHFVADYHHP